MTPERIAPADLLAPAPAARPEDIAARPEDIEVGDRLDGVEQPLGRLIKENHWLRTRLVAIGTELDRLRQLASAAGGTDPPVLMRAWQTAESYLDDAHRAAGRLVSEARRDADQIIREAQANADAIERSARHRHSQTVIGLESRRAALERDIARLRELEQEHRLRIQADLHSRLYELEDPDH